VLDCTQARNDILLQPG